MAEAQQQQLTDEQRQTWRQLGPLIAPLLALNQEFLEQLLSDEQINNLKDIMELPRYARNNERVKLTDAKPVIARWLRAHPWAISPNRNECYRLIRLFHPNSPDYYDNQHTETPAAPAETPADN